MPDIVYENNNYYVTRGEDDNWIVVNKNYGTTEGKAEVLGSAIAYAKAFDEALKELVPDKPALTSVN